MSNLVNILALDDKGQSNLQLILPLLLILVILVIFAFMIPSLSTMKMIAMVFGLCIFIIAFASTEIALYILIFSMLLSPEFVVGTTGGSSLSRGVTIRLDDLVLFIIGISWLARMAIKKELGLFLRTPLNKPIAYYILVCLISTLFGSVFGDVQLKTGFFYVLKYFEYMIIFFMVVNHLEDKKQVKNFLWAMLITCAIVSVIGIYQIPSGGRVTAPFEGAAGEPNTFGGYLVLMISVVSGLFLTSNSFKEQIIYGGLVFLFALPFFYTQSRSSYLAIVPAMITFLWLAKKRNLVFASLALVVIAFTVFTPRVTQDRITYTFTQGRDRTDVLEIGGVKLDTSTTARVRSWQDAAKDWIKHPFLGHGVTGYRFVDAQYMRIITETGLFGLFTFITLTVMIFRSSLDIFKDSNDEYQKGISMGFLAGFIGLLTHAIGANTFIIVRIMEPFWFLTAMVLMYPTLKEEAPEPDKKRLIPT